MTELTEQDWLDWRRDGATATGIADAANGTYGGEYSVVADKLGLITTEVTDAMERGHRWEDRLSDVFHAATGLCVVGEQSWCEYADNKRIRATVDGFASETPEASLADVLGVVEIKTFGKDVRPPWDRWKDQVQVQMLTSGTPKAWIIAACIDDDTDTLLRFTIVEVERDDMRIDWLIRVAERLLELIDSRTLPTPDRFTDLDDVKQVNAKADEGLPAVDLSEHAEVVERFVEVRDAVTLLEVERKELEAKIRHWVGEATKGTTGVFEVAVRKPRQELPADAEARLCKEWPEYAKTVLDKKPFQKDHKTIYADACTPTGARVVAIKRIKEEEQ